jgi:hypothetical protein
LSVISDRLSAYSRAALFNSPPSTDELPLLLERARQEGHSAGVAAGYKKARREDDQRRAEEAAAPSSDNESLAAYLLRELQDPDHMPPRTDASLLPKAGFTEDWRPKTED